MLNVHSISPFSVNPMYIYLIQTSCLLFSNPKNAGIAISSNQRVIWKKKLE